MGTATSKFPNDDQLELFPFPELAEESGGYMGDVMAKYSVLDVSDPVRGEVQEKLFASAKNSKKLSKQESRALGCFLGMGIGDALGAPLEFSPVAYGKTFVTSFNDTNVWYDLENNQFRLKPGQWTDDASMGLCLAESLLLYPEFDPIDLRIRFSTWWNFGYRSAFGYDSKIQHSVGLGGSINMSLSEFETNRSEYTTAGDSKTSGNGSIMRLAAVPIFFHDNLELALDIASKQSKTTHQGEEAAECCRLMSFIIIKFITSPEKLNFEQRKSKVFNQMVNEFHSPLYSIECLKSSTDEEEHESNRNLNLEDRKWNWDSLDFRYCESRANEQPGYIGSYAMDGLAMALHCVWSTKSFEEALLKSVNLRGDADTVGSITGQIAGSLYGVTNIPADWIKAIQQWDNNGDFAHTALKLFRKDNTFLNTQ